jgi:hypothetical protein
MKFLRRVTNRLQNALNRAAVKIIVTIACGAVPMAAVAQVQFTDVSTSAGIDGNTYVSTTIHGLGMNWIDFDSDGWPDLFVINGWNSDGAHLFRNERNGTFSNQDAILPVIPNLEMMGSVFADYDNDGDPDIYIFVDNHRGPVGPSAAPANILLKNKWVENGNQIIPGQPLFEDVAAAAGVDDLLDTPHADGPAYRSSTGGWLDYDRDGHVDLYVCHWDRGKHGEDSNKDRLYRNLGNGTFADVTDATIIPVQDGTYNRPCLAFVGAHLDSDLWPDIYIGNVDAPLPFSRDYIFQNNGGTGFTDRTLDSPGVGDDAEAAMGVTVGDIDLNGGWDLYLSDLQMGVEPLGNPLYLHTGTDILYNDNSADVAGVQASNSWGVNFFDADHDGYEDLLVATMGSPPAFLFMNDQGDGTFTEHPGGIGGDETRGSAYADYDRDGDLDVAIIGITGGGISGPGKLQLHRNDSTNMGHWLQIELVANDSQTGLWSNRSAIGTLVKVTANGKTHMRQVIGGDSGHGQNQLALHFGLGSATIVDQIEVFWPSGATEVLTNQSVDRFMTIIEAGGSAGTPALNSPIPGSVLPSGDVTFSWTTNGTAVDDWQLQVGTSTGDNSLYDSGILTSTTMSTVVSGLPEDASTLHVTLRWNESGVPNEANYTYTASGGGGGGGDPAMLSPVDGSTLAGASETFTWSPGGTAVNQWRLEVGTSPGGRDLYVQGFDSAITSTVVSGLPTDGSTVYVNLKWRTTGGPIETLSYTYTAFDDGGTPPPTGTPMITSPADGSTLSGSSETFTWSDEGTAVDRWRLEVGTTSGSTNLFVQTFDPATTSAVVNGLPTDGSTVFVTLRWRSGGTTTTASYTYTAFDDGGSPPPPTGTPIITSPTDGSTLSGSSETFTWSAEGVDVARWRLEVGTTPGGTDLFVQGMDAAVLSTVVSGLPTDGSTVYVNLKWRVAGGPVTTESYVYTASGP